MTTQIIAETEAPAQATLTSSQARNRRIFIAAIKGGCAVQYQSGDAYYVNSKTIASDLYRVDVRTNAAGRAEMKCNCEWGQRRGFIGMSKQDQPCGHMVIVRWARLDEEARALVLESDAELAALLAPAPATAEAWDWKREYLHPELTIREVLLSAGFSLADSEIEQDEKGYWRTTCGMSGFTVSQSVPTLVRWTYGFKQATQNHWVEQMRLALVAAGYTVTVSGKRRHHLVIENHNLPGDPYRAERQAA